MSTQMPDPQESLQELSQGDFSTLDALKNLVAVSYEESGLDPQTFMLVRMAALATLDAAPASWLMNLAVGERGRPCTGTGTRDADCHRACNRDCTRRIGSRKYPQGVGSRGKSRGNIG